MDYGALPAFDAILTWGEGVWLAYNICGCLLYTEEMKLDLSCVCSTIEGNQPHRKNYVDPS